MPIYVKGTIGTCYYCGTQTIIIDDYGGCPNGCPGRFTNCKTYDIELSDDTINRIHREGKS